MGNGHRCGVNIQLVPAAGGIVFRFAFSVVIENVGQAEVFWAERNVPEPADEALKPIDALGTLVNPPVGA